MEGMLSCGEGCLHIRVCEYVHKSVCVCVHVHIHTYIYIAIIGVRSSSGHGPICTNVSSTVLYYLVSPKQAVPWLYPVTHVCVNIVFSDIPDKRCAENGVSG